MVPWNEWEYAPGSIETPASKPYTQSLPIQAILMAGGLGSRMGALTKELPKPLLKVGQKCLIDYLLDLLNKHHISDVHIAIRYLGHKIVKHLLQNPPPDFSHLRFIRENKPLGTFGATSLLKMAKQPYILVVNSDILTNIDLTQMFHRMIKTKADLLVATTSYEVNIPYGILKTTKHKIEKFVEKPSYSFEANAGVYLFHKRLLPLIPVNEFFDAPEFIDLLIKKEKKVESFPIEGYWQDISRPSDYENACSQLDQIAHFP